MPPRILQIPLAGAAYALLLLLALACNPETRSPPPTLPALVPTSTVTVASSDPPGKIATTIGAPGNVATPADLPASPDAATLSPAIPTRIIPTSTPALPAFITPQFLALDQLSLELEVAFPGLTLRRMVFLTPPGDGSDRLFVALQEGRILVFPNQPRAQSPQVFLDIRNLVDDGSNEEGLLGLAFHPQFDRNGFFYVYYTGASPKRSIISRFSVNVANPDRADPASEAVILEVLQPFANHNGGHLAFGPDGFLYIGLGDGGNRGDPQGHGQNPGTLLGSILRIAPAATPGSSGYALPPDNPFLGRDGFREEIWAFGFRNPWRFSFDSATGDLWVGDVGQNDFEEVDLVSPGGNYGWNVFEGRHCFGRSGRPCDPTGLQPPVLEYPLSGGNCAVTGGYVYRGNRLPQLQGVYLYADFCSGRLWGLRHDGQQLTDQALILDSDLQIASFAVDQEGELLLLSFDGHIYRLR